MINMTNYRYAGRTMARTRTLGSRNQIWTIVNGQLMSTGREGMQIRRKNVWKRVELEEYRLRRLPPQPHLVGQNFKYSLKRLRIILLCLSTYFNLIFQFIVYSSIFFLCFKKFSRSAADSLERH